MFRPTKAPCANVGIDVACGVAMRRQRCIFEIAAHLEEQVDRRIGVVGERRGERLDDRAGAREQLAGRFDRAANRRLRLHAEAHVGEDADLQSLHVALQMLVIAHAIGGQAPGVALVLPRQHGQEARDIVHAAAHRACHAHGVGRQMRHTAMGRLQSGQSAMGGRKADRARDIRADGNIAGAGGDGGACAGRRAAGIPGEPPGIAGNAVQRADARRHQAAIRHRGLGKDHRAGLAERDRRRRIVVGGRQGTVGADAVKIGPADHGDAVLHGHGDAVERTQRRSRLPSRFRALRACHGLLRTEAEQRIDRGIDRLGMAEHGSQHLHRRQCARCVGLRQPRKAHPDQFRSRHLGLDKWCFGSFNYP
ncbi:hypothetical protein AB7M47_003797 [Bradyrhizobium elkanii]